MLSHSTHRRTLKNFLCACVCARVFVFQHGASDAKSCPEPLGGGGGGESSRLGLNGAGRSLEESCCRRSVLEQRNATSLNVHPVCCNDVAWSILPPHHHPPPHRQSKQRRFRNEQKYQLCSSFSGTDFFFFHSLTSCSLNPPFLCRGVVFRSPPATRGRPR